MKSQWDCFLENLGEWRGSFTRFSPQGEWLNDTPSVLVLEGFDHNQTIRLNLQREGQPDVRLEFTTVGGSLKFFETGAFSQGTIQIAPFSQFGAELALLHGDRRLRLVQLFDRTNQLESLTLIREQRDTHSPERPPLKLEDLLGEWQGNAVTVYPDFRDPETDATTLKLHPEGSNKITQELSFGSGRTIASTATIHGSALLFEQGSQTVQVLLLPDGASSTCPVQVKTGHPLFLEVGWLLETGLRQRLIRSYNNKGEWASLTLVTERRIHHPAG